MRNKILKKKIIICVLSLLMILVASGVYVFVLSKPHISVDKVTITTLELEYSGEKYGEDYDIVGTVEYDFNNALERKYKDMQLFWKDDELPSDDPKDYAVLTFYLNVENTSIFDSFCKYVLLNKYDEQSEILLVTAPQPVYYEFERLSSSDQYVYQIYIYIGDKTKEDIENLVESVQLQIPFSNTIHKNGNVYVDIDEVEITYEGM